MEVFDLNVDCIVSLWLCPPVEVVAMRLCAEAKGPTSASARDR